MFWDTILDISISERSLATCQTAWCHNLEEHKVTMLPPGTLQNIHKVLVVPVLHGCCYVYITCNFNSPHDGAGQYVDVLSVPAVVMLCVKWLGCCDYTYLTGICI